MKAAATYRYLAAVPSHGQGFVSQQKSALQAWLRLGVKQSCRAEHNPFAPCRRAESCSAEHAASSAKLHLECIALTRSNKQLNADNQVSSTLETATERGRCCNCSCSAHVNEGVPSPTYSTDMLDVSFCPRLLLWISRTLNLAAGRGCQLNLM